MSTTIQQNLLHTNDRPVAEPRTQPRLLEQIKNDALYFADLRQQVKAFVDDVLLVRNNRQQFIDLMQRFRDQLAIHFTLIETEGFFDDSIEAAPRFSGAVKSLLKQHVELFDMVREIADSTEELQAHASEWRFDAILQRLRDFDFAMEQHEQREQQVLYEALEVDLGGEG